MWQQNLGVVAIVTNCAILVCLYDDTANWKLEPGLAAILVLEHLLLLIKIGFSWFVPEVGSLILDFCPLSSVLMITLH
jgi:anoctamin-10